MALFIHVNINIYRYIQHFELCIWNHVGIEELGALNESLRDLLDGIQVITRDETCVFFNELNFSLYIC